MKFYDPRLTLTGRLTLMWFTTFELVIVLMIMAIIFTMLQWLFKPQNSDQIYGEVCVNTLYGEISKQVTNALTAKSFVVSNQKITPSVYTIQIDQTGNLIQLGYQSGASTVVVKSMVLWTATGVRYCIGPDYQVSLTGGGSIFSLSKNFQSTASQPGFGRSKGLTGEVLVQLCNRDRAICRDFYKLSVDTRVQQIRLVGCVQRSSPARCQIWRE